MATAEVIEFVANRARRTLESVLGLRAGLVTKHDHYADFGYPEEVTFANLFRMYKRNGIARAGVDKTVDKTWQTSPWLLDHERDDGEAMDETPLERDIRIRFTDLRLWARLRDADRMALAGGYSGVVLRLRDGRQWNEPVSRVNGLKDFFGVIPAWKGQLVPHTWDTDERSPTYGEPTMYVFNETEFSDEKNRAKIQRMIHPDRVLIWSEDGTLYADGLNEPGFNDLMTLEKVSGAGGEGFWKNAKSMPVIEADKDADISKMAKAFGKTPQEFVEAMGDQLKDFSKFFDDALFMQGMQAKTLSITLPSPEHFFNIALQSYAASIRVPLKILVGMQTGERASTEDAQEWAQTNNARRENTVKPNIRDLVLRLEYCGVLEQKDWFIDWTDLTESSMSEKIDRAVKMADINQKMAKDSQEIVFTGDEVREVVGLMPLTEGEKTLPEPPEQDVIEALPPTGK